MLSHPALPRCPHPRMNDRLQAGALGRAGKDPVAQSGPIDLAGDREDGRPKRLPHLLPHGIIVLEQIARASVRIERHRSEQLSQASREGGFAAGYAASYANCRHHT